MVDVWRVFHPHGTAYTWFRQRAASRIDRVHATAQIRQYITTCDMAPPPVQPAYAGMPAAAPPPGTEVSLSDHRMLFVSLAPAEPSARGRGPRRARIRFLKDPELRGRFKAWLLAEASSVTPRAGDSDYYSLARWEPFKHRLLDIMCSLEREHCARTRALREHTLQLQRAADQAAATLDALTREGADPAAIQAALTAATSARHDCYAAVRHDAQTRAHVIRERQQWLRMREYPHPRITALLKPPQSATAVPALRRADGSLEQRVRHIPEVMVDHFASISAQPAVDAAAQEEVLEAVRRYATPVSNPEVLQSLRNTTVTAADIKAAMARMRAATAPGPDGIPLEVYRQFKAILAPALAAVCTAIARTGMTPPGFLDGLITALHKKGDRVAAANYRPITLLGTDYRIMARVMTQRLQPALAACISTEQTAFLAKRLVGENIMLLQLLPSFIKLTSSNYDPDSPPAAAFIDFAKAYDTVDRAFLLRIMEALGIPALFIAWVRAMLNGTTARSVVNGFISTPRPFHAGVRQGCPLAPLLYLCLAQSLTCFLKSRGIGIPVGPSCHLTASQFADDTEAFLRSLLQQDIQPFVDAMATFAAATGQHINRDKTELLLQRPHLYPPPQVAGMNTVQQAAALGLVYGSSGPLPLDWGDVLARVKKRLKKICCMPMSAMGRGVAVSSYALSRALYRMEFSDLPSDHQLNSITALQQRVVDVQLPPDKPRGPGQYETGISAELMVGQPPEGGFGVLPLQEHVRARHLMWAVRLVAGCGSPTAPLFDPNSSRLPPAISKPLHMVAMETLSLADPFLSHPLQLLSVCGSDTMRDYLQRSPLQLQGASALNAPLRLAQAIVSKGGPALTRIFSALSYMPRLHVNVDAMQPGPWCYGLPVLRNPVIFPEGSTPAYSKAALHVIAYMSFTNHDQRHLHVPGFEWTALATLGGFMMLASMTTQPAAFAPAAPWVAHALTRVSARVTEVLAAVQQRRPSWFAAAQQHHQAVLARTAGVPTRLAVMDAVLPHLGWTSAEHSVSITRITVRSATRILAATRAPLRHQRHQEFVAAAQRTHTQALLPRPPPDAAAMTQFSQLLKDVWSLKLDNNLKEVLWRMTIDGVRGASSTHVIPDGPLRCGCGRQVHKRPAPRVVPGHPPVQDLYVDSRYHHFWACPVAQAVCTEIADCWEHFNGWRPDLQPTHLWLMQPPRHPADPDALYVKSTIWFCVALAALNAMNLGRRALTRMALDAALPPPAPPVLVDPQPAPRPLHLPQLPPAYQDHLPAGTRQPWIQEASTAAVSRFWIHIAELTAQLSATYATAPWTQDDEFGDQHPFITKDLLRSTADWTVFRVNRHVG